ncbi:MAG: hypothetical protein R2696_16845 [Microthrixaceae bacterium]
MTCREAVPTPEQPTLLAGRSAEVGATVVVADRVAQADERVITQAASLHERGVRIRTLEGFYAEWLGKLPVSELERASLFFDISELHNSRFARFKRLMDLAVSVLARWCSRWPYPWWPSAIWWRTGDR